MKVEKFKVLLYLKNSGLDKSGKAPIMGRITLNRTMAQFGCELSCTPKLLHIAQYPHAVGPCRRFQPAFQYMI